MGSGYAEPLLDSRLAARAEALKRTEMETRKMEEERERARKGRVAARKQLLTGSSAGGKMAAAVSRASAVAKLAGRAAAARQGSGPAPAPAAAHVSG